MRKRLLTLLLAIAAILSQILLLGVTVAKYSKSFVLTEIMSLYIDYLEPTSYYTIYYHTYEMVTDENGDPVLDENGNKTYQDIVMHQETVSSVTQVTIKDAPSHEYNQGATFLGWTQYGLLVPPECNLYENETYMERVIIPNYLAFQPGEVYTAQDLLCTDISSSSIHLFDVYEDYTVTYRFGETRPSYSVDLSLYIYYGSTQILDRAYGSSYGYYSNNKPRFALYYNGNYRDRVHYIHPGMPSGVFRSSWRIENENDNKYQSCVTTSTEVGTNYNLSSTNSGTSKFTMPCDQIIVEFDCRYSEGKLNQCIAPGTLVTLADRTQKVVEDVTYDDTLLVWDFFKGEYATVPASLIVDHGMGDYTQISLGFADGTSLNLLEAHALFDADLNRFVLLNENTARDYIGHRFIQSTDDGYTTQTLTSVEIGEVNTNSYSIVSAYHYNFIVEDMFSLTNSVYALTAGLEVGENLTYDAEVLAHDIEAFGLYVYDDLADYVTPEQFEVFAGKYLRISVGKGHLTYDEIVALILQFINPIS